MVMMFFIAGDSGDYGGNGGNHGGGGCNDGDGFDDNVGNNGRDDGDGSRMLNGEKKNLFGAENKHHG